MLALEALLLCANLCVLAGDEPREDGVDRVIDSLLEDRNNLRVVDGLDLLDEIVTLRPCLFFAQAQELANLNLRGHLLHGRSGRKSLSAGGGGRHEG